MAIALDKANAGSAQGDVGGSSYGVLDVLLSALIASTNCLVWLTVSLESAGSAPTINSCSGGGATWTSPTGATVRDSNSSQATRSYYASNPTPGADISIGTTGTGFEWIIACTSFTANGGLVAEGVAVDSKSFTSGTAWASNNIVTTNRSVIVSGVSARGPNSSSGGNGIEDQDLNQATTISTNLVIKHQIQDAGTYTNSGTWNSATDGASMITYAFKEANPIVVPPPVTTQSDSNYPVHAIFSGR